MLVENGKVLRNRYSLIKSIPQKQQQSWLGMDQDGGSVLVKVWPFEGTQPNDVVRALWDRELRNLFRLSSSPGAETSLVLLRDAAIDQENRCFVMVLAAPGYERFSDFLEHRSRHDWLRDLRSPEVRIPLWKSLRQLALGLTHLHGQQMLHRAVTAASVFLDGSTGPESMRLGGFEWTIRVGQAQRATETEFGLPPEFLKLNGQAYSFESDWYQFGCLVAQVFAGVDSSLAADASRNEEMRQRIRDTVKLLDIEKDFISSLVERLPQLRLSRGYEIADSIAGIVSRLDQPTRFAEDSYLGLVLLLGSGQMLTTEICDQEEGINALDTDAQRRFVEGDLSSATLVTIPSSKGDAYLLQGRRLVYFIKEYKVSSSDAAGRWTLAFCGRAGEIRFTRGAEDQVQLTRLPIRAFRRSDIGKDQSVVVRGAVSWKLFFPRGDTATPLRESQERFHDFFRFTNQVELLFRDAEIFPYQLVDYKLKDALQTAIIEEGPRHRRLFKFAETSGGMLGFLQLQKADKRFGELVYLGAEDSVSMDRSVPRPEFWKIEDFDEKRRRVVLTRTSVNREPPLKRGFLRCFEMFGQIKLIKRRRRAIDRFGNYSFLLRALRAPDTVFMDTGDDRLPMTVDSGKVDEAKRHALQNIWRTRPIFALQGPPGTGKTTLVANLLGQILHDDPVAQILVTAQAHSAVDVLRDKVSKDIFSDVSEERRPLSVRLAKGVDEDEQEEDSIYNVTLRLLDRAQQNENPPSPLQVQWKEEAKKAANALRREGSSNGAPDLCELVKRSANIVYSTTTAGDLEAMADMTQSFDWSLIEESGKAHGFDLVLPLQTGHRWVLIGDQNQLPPYRFQDFVDATESPNEVMEELAQLPERAGGLVDLDLIQKWRDLSDEEKAARLELWRVWLPVFSRLHRVCTEAAPADVSSQVSVERGVLATMLWQQHRMHPTIAGLISAAYYDREIESMTIENGQPLSRVIHPFTRPDKIQGCQIVWIDVGWSGTDLQDRKTSRESQETSSLEAAVVKRFLNTLQPMASFSDKLRLAVLSPYRRQVFELSRALQDVYEHPPAWLEGLPKNEFPASTVDSFQGNQADIVIVSLVRQNNASPGSGLGFLKESPRMNVLFSRAERLLVLVGSWDFFKYQTKFASPDKNQPLGHWKLALQYIESQCREGKACLLNGKTFDRQPL
jgi:hypothetical protein